MQTSICVSSILTKNCFHAQLQHNLNVVASSHASLLSLLGIRNIMYLSLTSTEAVTVHHILLTRKGIQYLYIHLFEYVQNREPMDVTHVEKYALHLYKYVHNVQNIWHTNNKRHGMGEETLLRWKCPQNKWIFTKTSLLV